MSGNIVHRFRVLGETYERAILVREESDPYSPYRPVIAFDDIDYDAESVASKVLVREPDESVHLDIEENCK